MTMASSIKTSASFTEFHCTQIIRAGERRNLTESLNCLRLASLIRCRQAFRDIMNSVIHDQNQSRFLGSQFFSIDMIFLSIYVPHQPFFHEDTQPPPPPPHLLQIDDLKFDWGWDITTKVINSKMCPMLSLLLPGDLLSVRYLIDGCGIDVMCCLICLQLAS